MTRRQAALWPLTAPQKAPQPALGRPNQDSTRNPVSADLPNPQAPAPLNRRAAQPPNLAAVSRPPAVYLPKQNCAKMRVSKSSGVVLPKI